MMEVYEAASKAARNADETIKALITLRRYIVAHELMRSEDKIKYDKALCKAIGAVIAYQEQ